MKGDAYSFARDVDREIEGLSRRDYLLRLREGRAKRLREELYPLSRLALSFKQPGLEVEIEGFEDSRSLDGIIRVAGFNPREFGVEVTFVYSHEEALRDEVLVAEGVVPGAGKIWREKRTREVHAVGEAVSHDEHYGRIAGGVIKCVKAKVSHGYATGTVLLIAFEEVRLRGHADWEHLFRAIDGQGGLMNSVFASIYLFNCATNELRQAV